MTEWEKTKSLCDVTKDTLLEKVLPSLKGEGYMLRGPWICVDLDSNKWGNVDSDTIPIAIIRGEFEPPCVGNGPFSIVEFDLEGRGPYVNKFYDVLKKYDLID